MYVFFSDYQSADNHLIFKKTYKNEGASNLG